MIYQQIDNNTIIMIILFAILLIITVISEFRKRSRLVEYVTRELVECSICKYSYEEEYEPGDFISMIKGTCPKCGKGVLKIRAIYSVEKK
ncbi:MAG: hypothetical protein QXO78_02125 [Desulfurococcaceae archaeon]